MLKAVRMIVARKVIARRQPYVATSREVYELTGKSQAVQLDEAAALERRGVLIIGKTFNDFYYKIV